MQGYLTMSEWAARRKALGLSHSTRYLRRLCQQGRVPGSVLVGKTYLVPESVKIAPLPKK